MHDIKDIRANPEKYRIGLKNRGQAPEIIDQLLEVDKELRFAKTTAQELQSRANRLSDIIAIEKRIEKLDKEIADKEAEIVDLDEQALESLAPFAGILEEIVEEIRSELT